MTDPYLPPGTADSDDHFNLPNARGRKGGRTVKPPTTTMVYCSPCMRHWEAPAREDWWKARVELCPKHQEERQQMIDQLPEELIVAAKKELSYQEWFIALPNNAAEDEAVFTLALEMQEAARLEEAMAKTEHLKSIEEYRREAEA